MKAVFFDLDGTLADSKEIILNIYQTKYEGFTKKDFEDMSLQNVFHFDFSRFSLLHNIPFDDVYVSRVEEIHLYPGVKEMLIRLSLLPIQIFLISSSTIKVIEPVLAINNIRQYFVEVLGKETSQNKEDKIRMLCEQYSLQKNEVLYVGDVISDYLAASDAGVEFAAAGYGFHPKALWEKTIQKKIDILPHPQAVADYIEAWLSQKVD